MSTVQSTTFTQNTMRTWQTVVVATTILATLAGCSSVNAPSQIAAMPHRELASPAAAEAGLQAGTPASNWWQAFGDPQLNRLVQEAMERNLDVQAQVAGVKAARGLLAERRFDGTPSGGTQVGYGSRRLSGPDLDPGGTSDFRTPIQRLANTDVVASWEIDLFGRIGTARAIAGRGIDMAQADLHAVTALLQGEVVRRYIALREWQQLGQMLASEVQVAVNLEWLLAQSIQRGLTDVRESAAARARVAELKMLLAQAQAQSRNEVAALAVLIARSPLQIDQDPLLVALTVAQSVPTAPELRTFVQAGELLARRPDVQRADAVLRATLGQKVLADRAFLPSLSLDFSAGLNQSTRRLDFDNAQRFFVGGILQWNPLDFGRLRARAAAASADGERAQAQFEQVVLRAIEDSEGRLRDWYVGRLAEEQATAAATAIERQRFVTDARVVAGLDAKAVGLSAALEASRAKRGALQAKAQHTLAYAQVQLALMAWQPSAP
jgi:outer membrane protein TolC